MTGLTVTPVDTLIRGALPDHLSRDARYPEVGLVTRRFLTL